MIEDKNRISMSFQKTVSKISYRSVGGQKACPLVIWNAKQNTKDISKNNKITTITNFIGIKMFQCKFKIK